MRQIGRSDDLDKLCWTPFGRKRHRQQEDCINIVDWVHRVTFK